MPEGAVEQPDAADEALLRWGLAADLSVGQALGAEDAMIASASISREELEGSCPCPCHTGPAVVHPVPCCPPCARCGKGIPVGSLGHKCVGDQNRLLHGLTKYDGAFALAITLAVALVAVWSVPYPGSLLLVAVTMLGCGIALLRARRNRLAECNRPHLDGRSL